VRQGKGVVEKGAPRLLVTNPPHYAGPILEHLVGEMGMAMVTREADYIIPDVGGYDDPYEILSLFIQGSLATGLSRKIPVILEACKKYRVDGVLDQYHIGCRTTVGDAMVIRDVVTRELGLPVLLLEVEHFDPRLQDQAQLRKSLEAFRTVLRKRAN
jgi:benzoyl-CoA reductase/2-hydroxyglutaryl-CoA dehydratase subunit BcrC/BadD/HgdB